MIPQPAALIDSSFEIGPGWVTWGFERGGPWQFREDPVTRQ